MGEVASQITSLTIVYSTVYSDADQRKYQSSASLAFVRGIHRRPVNPPHNPFDDVIMEIFPVIHGEQNKKHYKCTEKALFAKIQIVSGLWVRNKYHLKISLFFSINWTIGIKYPLISSEVLPHLEYIYYSLGQGRTSRKGPDLSHDPNWVIGNLIDWAQQNSPTSW